MMVPRSGSCLLSKSLCYNTIEVGLGNISPCMLSIIQVGLKKQVTGSVQSPEKLSPCRLTLLRLSRFLSIQVMCAAKSEGPFRARDWVRTTKGLSLGVRSCREP